MKNVKLESSFDELTVPDAHELAHFNVKEASSLTESDGVIAAAQQADATYAEERWGYTLDEVLDEFTSEQIAKSEYWFSALQNGKVLKFSLDDQTLLKLDGNYYWADEFDADQTTLANAALDLLMVHIDLGTFEVSDELPDYILSQFENSRSKTPMKKENQVKNRKLTRVEAVKAIRKLNENRKRKLRLMREDEVESSGDVFAVVTMNGDSEVKFIDGNLLIGPFDSEEAAAAAVGDDVVTVTGDEVINNASDDTSDVEVLEPELEEGARKVRSNFLRMRKQVAEAVRRKVLARIRRESEELDSLDSDVKKGDEATDAGEAGVHDFDHLATSVNPPEESGEKLDVDTDSDATADNSDDNVLESAALYQVGCLVDIVDRVSNKKVDTAIIESYGQGKFTVEGGEVYATKQYAVRQVLS